MIEAQTNGKITIRFLGLFSFYVDSFTDVSTHLRLPSSGIWKSGKRLVCTLFLNFTDEVSGFEMRSIELNGIMRP